MTSLIERQRARGSTGATRRRWVEAVLVLVAYALAVQLSIDLTVPAFGLSGFFVATGLLVATLGRQPYRLWPLGLACTFLTDVGVRYAAGQTTSRASLFAAADALEFVVAALVLRRFLGTRSSFTRPLGIVAVTVSIGVAAAVGASIGHLGAESNGVPVDHFTARAVLLWIVGRTLGGLIMFSTIDAWRLRERDRLSTVRPFEVAIVVSIVLLAGGVGSAVPQAGTITSVLIGGIRTIALVWLPVRIGRRATATVLGLLIYEYASLAITGEVAPFGIRLVWVGDVDELTLGIGTSEILLSLVTTVVFMLVLAAMFAERRRSIREARASEQRFRAIAESTNDALIVADTEHVITFANPAARSMVLRDDLVGSTLGSLLSSRAEEPWSSMLAPSGDGPLDNRCGIFLQRADGQELPVEAALASYELADGTTAYTVVLRDQTERRTTEQELRRFAADLERSNQDLAEFAYVASHDLQEPLRMVASFLRLLEQRYKGRLDDDADQFIGYAVDGAERLNALVADLLRYSRAGTTALERRAVDLGTVAHESLDLLRMQVRETGARITIDQLPIVSGNATLLTQVLQNLLSNAMKFHAAGHVPDIHVTWRESIDGPIVLVTDHGIGVPADQRDAVFQPFRRLHARDAFPGNGIGLSVCRKIIERHGGRIWLEETPGGGTTVCFQLQPALRRIA